MKKTLKIFKWTAIILGSLLAATFIFIQLTWNKKFTAPYPDIKASKDSTVIARGKYLAFGPAHCATCHVPMDKIMAVENGLEIPLSGGWELEFPGFGNFRAPNLTPDTETGIGKLTDADLARSIRHSVGSDGRLIFPFMSFQEMSDEDLTAVISFLRSQEPVSHLVPRTEYGLLGKALVAFGLLKPEGPKNTPQKAVVRDSIAEYGKYLTYHVANCRGCHTEMDVNTGQYIGADFSGGTLFEPDAFSNGYSHMSPNLTPDPNTGVITKWSEDQFLTRFTTGRIHEGSPMPWGAFSNMDSTDLKAIYRYLHSLQPVERKVAQTVIPPVEK
ncbi:MAG: c-type cytochrome [Saprospiraceae bacterium]|nr:c-type cytochrome [Saprospiraceae bacterium]